MSCHVDITTYRVLVFNQTLIVAAQTDQEQDTCHVLEAVYPLPTLALLTADVDHQHLVFAQMEHCFGDAYRPRPSVNNVLFIWHICGVEQTVKVGEEVAQARAGLLAPAGMNGEILTSQAAQLRSRGPKPSARWYPPKASAKVQGTP